MQCFYHGKILLKDGICTDKAVFVEGGKIFEIAAPDQNPELYARAEKIDLRGNILLPGFIDIHVHGGGGADFMDGSAEAMRTAAFTHLRHGTTTIFPTTMSAKFGEIMQTISVYRMLLKDEEAATLCGGLHLEGPFISPKMSGAQRRDLIYTPTDEMTETLKANADVIARISCAPEENGVLKMAEELLPCGVQFSMGHTAATYEQAEIAAQKGFTSVTHLYSATSGFHKVDQKVHIGVTQAGYGIDELYVELIGDGCHVPKELLRLVSRLKGEDKICLVTDAMRAAGTNAKESYLGAIRPENRVIIDDGVAKLPDKSSFAGSIGTMDKAFRFAVLSAGLSIEEASRITSYNQAKLMKIENKKGSIERGKDADFVSLDEKLCVSGVYVRGKKRA